MVHLKIIFEPRLREHRRYCTIKKKRGGGVGGQGAGFSPQPFQVGEKEKKRKKQKQKFVPQAGFEPRTLRYQILHLTAWLNLTDIYSSSPIS